MSLIITSTLKSMDNNERQAKISKQETDLISSINSFNQKELALVKEYTKTLSKAAHYTDNYLNDKPINDDPHESMLNVRLAMIAMKIGKLKGLYDFIQNIHVQLCALCSLVENEHLELEYELFPFSDGKSPQYIASLAERILETIKAMQN
jgi:hypothetical protein